MNNKNTSLAELHLQLIFTRLLIETGGDRVGAITQLARVAPAAIGNSYLRIPEHLSVNRVIKNVFSCVQYISRVPELKREPADFTCGEELEGRSCCCCCCSALKR